MDSDGSSAAVVETKEEVLRIHIGGDWSLVDFQSLFADLSTLASVAMPVAKVVENEYRWGVRNKWREFRSIFTQNVWFDETLERAIVSGILKEFEYGQVDLRIRKIVYGSPGIVDLAGLGKIAGHVKEFILAVINRNDQTAMRALKEEEQRQKNIKLAIDNAERMLKLTANRNIDDETRRLILGQITAVDERMSKLVADSKLKRIEVVRSE